MTGPLRIFAINLGSTSTKVAYYEDEQCIHRDTIDHDSADLRRFTSVFDQGDLRKEVVLAYLGTKGIELSQLDAFVSRGGQTQPIPGGVYRITPEMVSQAEGGDFGVHVCSVGCRIALDLTRDVRAIPLTVDTPSTDEFQQLARISGLKGIERRSCFQALNQQAMARFYARSIGRDYQELNLVVAMLGGGISVVAHRQGVMIDGPDALEGEGPFSNNRSGTLPPGALVGLCFTDSPDMDSMLRTINGESGLVSYLGTTDIRAIEARIGAGDAYAAEILKAMCYQTAKDIGAYATVLKGAVDAILLVGGMANSRFITQHIEERVEFIAPVVVLPGEREMESLCLRAYDALTGREPVREFIPKQ